MKMTPIVNDAYRLRKLLEKATGIKVYKSDLISNYFPIIFKRKIACTIK